MKEPIGVCLVGYGGIAAFHAEALQEMRDVRRRTVVGRRSEPTEAFRRQWGFEAGTTDLAEALADERVDAVIVASPSELHYEMSMAALEAGKDLLVEIPLALSAEGARRIAAQAAATGRQVMVAHTRRFEGVGRFAHDFLRSGRAGRILQHHSYWFWLRHENVGWTGYRRSWVDDVLFHHGCHLVDFSLWSVADAVRRVHGELAPLSPLTGTSLDFSLLIRYAGDAIATISMSYNVQPAVSGQLFVCERGTLALTGHDVKLDGEELYSCREGLQGGVRAQDRVFVDAVRGGERVCQADEAVAALEVLQAVYDQAVAADGEERYRRPWGL